MPILCNGCNIGAPGDAIPLQSAMVAVIRAFNRGGFTAAGIVPVLELAEKQAARHVDLAAHLSSGNVAQSRSDAARNLARIRAILGRMEAAAKAGDKRVWSNPSTVWTAIKDAVVAPYRWASQALEAANVQSDVDAQIPAELARAVREVPKTIGQAGAKIVEGARDVIAPIVKAAVGFEIPRWPFYVGGVVLAGLGVSYVARTFRRRPASA